MKASIAAVLIVVAGCGGGNKKAQDPTPPPGDMGAADVPVVAEKKLEEPPPPPPPPPPPDTGGYKIVAPGELQWMPLNPDGPGPEMAAVHGNPMEGPSAFFLRIPPGGKATPHTHTADYQAVVV